MDGKNGKDQSTMDKVAQARLGEAWAFLAAGRYADALTAARPILDDDPEHSAALYLLGLVSLRVHGFDGAAGLFAKAVAAAPDEARNHLGLGEALLALEKYDQASLSLRRAGSLDPDLEGLAVLWDKLESRCREVLFGDGEDMAANFALGQALKAGGRGDEGLIHHRRALKFNPGYALTDPHDGPKLLAAGKLKEGWAEFEWRSTIGGIGPFTEMVWNGEDLAGRTILIWGEQGIGEQILFANCIADVIDAAGKVIIEVDERLVPLFARSFREAVVHGEVRYQGGEPARWTGIGWLEEHGPVDFFIPQGSLGRFFRRTLASFPGRRSVLTAAPQDVASWRRRMEGLGPERKVGVAWRSVLMTEKRAAFYPPPDAWAPLFALPETKFVAVQANLEEAGRREMEQRFAITLNAFDDIDLVDDLDGTAALLSSLDAVVSADTYLPMLAAAVGTPTWRVTRSLKEKDWSFLGAEQYPWFPTMSVHFGETDDELTAVFERIARRLSDGVNRQVGFHSF